jgi:hypothetical protein
LDFDGKAYLWVGVYCNGSPRSWEGNKLEKRNIQPEVARKRKRKLHSANFERASVDHVITGEDDLRIAVRDATAIP